MPDIHQLGDLLDICLARSESVLDEAAWSDLAKLRGHVRRRAGFLGELLVVALAGGTGSGKSSLFNALSHAQIATVGIERPTTSECLAALPADAVGDIEEFVAALGIDRTVFVDGLDRMVLVDLPDFDSTFTDHRGVVESVLAVVDAVVWVFDPEKYADRLIHESFLAPLARHEDQMLFVLNQVDRLGDDADLVAASLRSHLRGDGFRHPEVVCSIAAPSERVDVQVDAVHKALRSRLDIKDSAMRTLAVDIAQTANALWRDLRDRHAALEGSTRGDTALAMASFVSLGIAAHEAAAAHPAEEGRRAIE
ncbi:MAG: GTPase [Acidimicrobiia bacterium]